MKAHENLKNDKTLTTIKIYNYQLKIYKGTAD